MWRPFFLVVVPSSANETALASFVFMHVPKSPTLEAIEDPGIVGGEHYQLQTPQYTHTKLSCCPGTLDFASVMSVRSSAYQRYCNGGNASLIDRLSLR